MKRLWVILILLLAFLGLADSAYLVQNEINGTPLICNVQNLSGCNTVVSSQYSHILGIPLAMLGAIFYGILFVVAAIEIVLYNRFLRRTLQALSLIGVIASLYFILVQVFFIGAFCIYCLASSVIAFLIFAFASRIEPLRRNGESKLVPAASPQQFKSQKEQIRMPPTP